MERLPRQAKTPPRLRLEAALREAIEIALVWAVDLVAHHGEPGLAQVNADLVLTSGLWHRLDERKVVSFSAKAMNHREPGASRLALLPVDPHRDAHCRAAFGDRRVDRERVRWEPLADGEVFLVHLPRSECVHQRTRRLRRSPTDEHARSLAIEPMGGPRRETIAVLLP